MIRRQGIEGALSRLYEAGVHLTLDEFKGKIAVRRGQLELSARAELFDNPRLTRHVGAATGGSAEARRRLILDLDLLRFETALHVAFLASAGLLDAPMALWRSVPPGSAGMKRAWQQARPGLLLERWFTHEPFSIRRPATRSWAATLAALASSRLAGKAILAPETAGPADAVKVARWVASVLAVDRTPHLDTIVTSGVRVVHAGREAGAGLRGSFFRLGGEPLTPSQAALFHAAGKTPALDLSSRAE